MKIPRILIFYSRRDLLEYFESKVTDAVKLREEGGMRSLFLRELQSALNSYCNALAVYAGNDLDKYIMDNNLLQVKSYH